MFGIDVSQYQGDVDWEKVKEKVDFAIIRLGWIGNKQNHTLDTKFERNYTECKRLGIPVGVYVYNYCDKEENAKKAAEWVVAQLQGKSLELPVYIDMEESTIEKQGKEKLTNICIAFNTVIEQSGFWAGVYANKNWYENYLNKDEIKKRYTTWIATYNNKVDLYKGEYDIWQNSMNGTVDGVTSDVDTDYMYRDLIKDISKTTGNKVNEDNSSNETIYVIKKGDTLSKIAQMYNTTYQELAKKNNIKNPDKIYAGEKLKI